MKMRNLLVVMLSLMVCGTGFARSANAGRRIVVATVDELLNAVASARPGDHIVMGDGVYRDVKLSVTASGCEQDSIVICAANPGRVDFSGDTRVELHGDYIVLRDIIFRNGSRNPAQWRSHGPGLVAIYGSHNRITDCLFHAFDTAVSAWITTSLGVQGHVPQYCRIDHCSFVEKTTNDQVINLNNTSAKSDEGEPGIPMYHRIDHCYFSNPKKEGNAGGSIRIGYWRKDYGRCLIDHNLFERQDSEPEIITGKSMENVYWANSYVNCRGTLNFRHGDRQAAVGNIFTGTDTRYEYGGMFVWGSGHLIAANYFNLSTTIRSRGNAALYFNPGPVGSEHALAFDTDVAGNLFCNINGYDVHLAPLYEIRRKTFGAEQVEAPHSIRFTGNIFYSGTPCVYTVFCDLLQTTATQQWDGNYYWGKESGLPGEVKGMEKKNVKKGVPGDTSGFTLLLRSIEGIDLDLVALANLPPPTQPLTHEQVGPRWADGKFHAVYPSKGELSPHVKRQFEEIKKRENQIAQ